MGRSFSRSAFVAVAWPMRRRRTRRARTLATNTVERMTRRPCGPPPLRGRAWVRGRTSEPRVFRVARLRSESHGASWAGPDAEDFVSRCAQVTRAHGHHTRAQRRPHISFRLLISSRRRPFPRTSVSPTRTRGVAEEGTARAAMAETPGPAYCGARTRRSSQTSGSRMLTGLTRRIPTTTRRGGRARRRVPPRSRATQARPCPGCKRMPPLGTSPPRWQPRGCRAS